jgi:ABC-type bacteriocin/lantibiotic exporter with double-glycine peptidase domain
MLSEEAVTLDLPLVRQDELHECGLSAISALCQYWNVSIPAEARIELAQRAAAEEGLSGAELRAALESFGMEVFLFRGTIDRTETGLYGHVDEGRPLVVMLSLGEAGNHYCLLLGYDEPRRMIALLDPARGEVLRSLDTFEKAWRDCDRFTLLALPESDETALPLGPRPVYRGASRPPRNDR